METVQETRESLREVPLMENWKQIIFKSEPYKKFIRGHHCLLCDRPPEVIEIQAHHERLRMNMDASKTHDSHCVPLCIECHVMRHGIGWTGWEDKAINIEWRIIKYLTEYLTRGTVAK